MKYGRRNKKPLPPVEVLRKKFMYDPDSGNLIHREDAGNNKVKGQVAGYLLNSGYVCVKIGGKDYQAHRIIWAMVYGEDPGAAEIDHRDLCRSNNRLDNLRKATPADQNSNRNTHKNRANKLPKNVYRVSTGGYQVSIGFRGKKLYLGYFDTVEEAEEAAVFFRQELHGEFAR